VRDAARTNQGLFSGVDSGGINKHGKGVVKHWLFLVGLGALLTAARAELPVDPSRIEPPSNGPAVPPLGSADFVPTSERPVGFLGDGGARYPGATPVTTWDVQTGRNIVWKTPLPAWSCASPIVVVGKVFVCAEPHTLLCVEAASGKILWQKANDPLELFPPEEAAAARKIWQGELDKQIEAWMAVWKQRGVPSTAPATNRSPYAFSPFDPYCYRKDTPQYKESAAIRHDLVRKYGICFEYWPGSIGHTFATPVSDGMHVYVSFGWGQVACYDLVGKRKWLKWFKPDMSVEKDASQGGYPNSYFCNSPRLIDDKLIVQAGCYLRALRKDTGEQIWETRYRPLRFTVGLSQIMRLPGIDLLVTGHERIYDLATGKVVASGMIQGYGSPIVHGDTVYLMQYSAHCAPAGKACGAWHVSVDAGGKVSLRSLWNNGAASWVGPVFDDGLLYVDGDVYEAADGAPVQRLKQPTCRGPHPVIAGGHYFVIQNNGTTIVAEKGRGGKIVFKGTVQTDDPRRTFRGEGDPQQVRQRWWDQCVYGVGTTSGSVVATPFFEGKRLYVRTFDALLCIGE
jgi:outer membrane protein assembly factor BamB